MDPVKTGSAAPSSTAIPMTDASPSPGPDQPRLRTDVKASNQRQGRLGQHPQGHQSFVLKGEGRHRVCQGYPEREGLGRLASCRPLGMSWAICQAAQVVALCFLTRSLGPRKEEHSLKGPVCARRPSGKEPRGTERKPKERFQTLPSPKEGQTLRGGQPKGEAFLGKPGSGPGQDHSGRWKTESERRKQG